MCIYNIKLMALFCASLGVNLQMRFSSSNPQEDEPKMVEHWQQDLKNPNQEDVMLVKQN